MDAPSLAATGNRQQATGNRQQATGNRQRDNARHRLTLAFYLLLIAISMMAMVNPARASGLVFPSSATYFGGGPDSNCFGKASSGEVESCTLDYFVQQNIQALSYLNNNPSIANRPISCPSPVLADLGNIYQGQAHIGLSSFVDAFSITYYIPTTVGYFGGAPGGNAYCGNSNEATYGIISWQSSLACPANSTGTPATNPTSCTCNDPYVPDSTQTSCVQEQYTISIQPAPANSGAYTILPSATLPLTAIVTDQNGVVQQGIQVTLTANVQDGTGGHIHNENRSKGSFTWCGSMPTTWTCTLTTGYNGQAPFLFVSTPVSGIHTITATCSGCGNTANATVNVKVPDLIPIPASPTLYALEDSAGNTIGAIPLKHTDNHYLTTTAIGRLNALARLYKTKINPKAILYLNDASLVWGGLFDVGSTPWSSPHSLHDTGVSLDIRAANSGTNSEGAVPATDFREFIKQAKGNGFKMGLHCKNSSDTNYCLGQPNNRHFHVDF